jgi:uroporphyrinogen decarboxylase
MDRRERIRRVFRGERSDRVPRAFFGGGRWAYRQAGLRSEAVAGNPRGFAEALAAVYAGLDTDIVFAGSGLNTFPAEAIGGELAFREEQAPLLAAPLIQKTEDARYLARIDIADSPYICALHEMIVHLRNRLPDRFLCMTTWGPFTWAMILCDWSLLQTKTVEDREFVREVCELGARLSSAFLRPLVDGGMIDGVVMSDGAATLVDLDLYCDVILPSERKFFAQLKESGAVRLLHQCGNITAQLPFYADTGADCISLDSGVQLSDAYRIFDRPLVLAGNVDVVKYLFGGSITTVCQAVSDCLSGVSDPFRNYILMPSCDLPLETPLANVKAFLACADGVGHHSRGK